MTGSRAAAFLPLVFVLLYGSGFVVAKIGIADASPLAFLVLRFVIASALATLIAAVIRAPWPRGRNLAHQVAAGLLSVAGFSGFSYIALTLGMPVAIIALVIALSPLVVATGAAPVLGERLNARQWCGLALGVLGVALVIAHRLHWNSQHALGLLLTIAALLSLGSGTLYQKRFAANMNVLTGGALQSGASAVVLAIVALFFEHVHLAWTPAFLASLAYMSIGVSIGAMSVLYVMLQIGGANQVARFFYLIPIVAAIGSYIFFHETFDALAVVGTLVAGAGVILAGAALPQPTRAQRAREATSNNMRPLVLDSRSLRRY